MLTDSQCRAAARVLEDRPRGSDAALKDAFALMAELIQDIHNKGVPADRNVDTYVASWTPRIDALAERHGATTTSDCLRLVARFLQVTT